MKLFSHTFAHVQHLTIIHEIPTAYCHNISRKYLLYAVTMLMKILENNWITSNANLIRHNKLNLPIIQTYDRYQYSNDTVLAVINPIRANTMFYLNIEHVLTRNHHLSRYTSEIIYSTSNISTFQLIILTYYTKLAYSTAFAWILSHQQTFENWKLLLFLCPKKWNIRSQHPSQFHNDYYIHVLKIKLQTFQQIEL